MSEFLTVLSVHDDSFNESLCKFHSNSGIGSAIAFFDLLSYSRLNSGSGSSSSSRRCKNYLRTSAHAYAVLLAAKNHHQQQPQQQQKDVEKEEHIVEHSPPRTSKLFRPYLDANDAAKRVSSSEDDVVVGQVTMRIF